VTRPQTPLFPDAEPQVHEEDHGGVTFQADRGTHRVLVGPAHEVLATLPTASVHAVVTSPPYWGLRSYGSPQVDWPAVTYRPMPGLDVEVTVPAGRYDLGMEGSPWDYVGHIVLIMREVRRVLRPDGCLWLNLGDCHASDGGAGGSMASDGLGSPGRADLPRPEVDQPGFRRWERDWAGLKNKDVVGIPWRTAFALQADGWYLRSAPPWPKRNCLPESVDDRPPVSHETMFLLTPSPDYYYDQHAVRVPLRSAVQYRRLLAIGARQDREYDHDEHSRFGKRSGNRVFADGAALERGLAGRFRRTHDWWFDGLREILADHEALLQGPDGEPLGFAVNPVPCSWAFCGACGTLYEGTERGRIKKREEPDPEHPGRRRKILTCECGREDAWIKHFAAFPERLIEPAIRAGTSDLGACTTCGAPWRRIVSEGGLDRDGAVRLSDRDGGLTAEQGWERSGLSHCKAAEAMAAHPPVTVGWQASCECEASEPRPAVVLDPFGGSGTTGRTAARLARSSVSIELLEDYARVARARVGRRVGA
jgi:DNA modification methylase